MTVVMIFWGCAMYFLIDAIIIALTVLLVVVSIKFGFSRNFVFGILRTIIGIGGAVGACVGVYLLMDKFGWLDYMADGVVGFFGNVSNPGELLNDTTFRMIAKVIAFLPLALLFLIVGYIILHKLINWIVKLVFLPFFVARKKCKVVKIIDNVLGLVLNLGLFFGVIFASFGFIHAVNTAKYSDGTYVYENVSRIMFEDNTNAINQFAGDTIDNIATPMLNKWHENLTASPIGSLIYEYNPLNGVFDEVVKGIFNK